MRSLVCLAVALSACSTRSLPFVETTKADLATALVHHPEDLSSSSPDLAPHATTIHVDQSHVEDAGWWSDLSNHNVQTLTVGVDGTLIGIECLFMPNGDPPLGTITLDVANDATLVKLGTAVLDASGTTSSTSLALDSIGPGYFTLSPGIAVAAGQKLRFELSGPTLFVAYGYAPFEGGTDYPGGESYSNSWTLGRDLLFKTFVAY